MKKRTYKRILTDFRKRISIKTSEDLTKKYNELEKKGIYPWESFWLTPQKVKQIQDILKKRDKVVFAELIVLFLFLTLFCLVFFLFVMKFLPGNLAS